MPDGGPPTPTVAPHRNGHNRHNQSAGPEPGSTWREPAAGSAAVDLDVPWEEQPRPPLVHFGGRSLRPVFGVLTAGVILGALLGSLFGGSGRESATAAALIQVAAAADPGLLVLQSGAQSENSAEAFVAAEFAWLSGAGLRAAVRDRLDTGTEPVIAVTRVGKSSVVNVSATGVTDSEALSTVEAAVAVYSQRRSDQLRQSIDASLVSIDRTLLEISNSGERMGDDLRALDQDRIDRLRTMRADLLLVRFREIPPVQVLDQPALLPTGGAASSLLPGALGAVLGGLLAVGGLMLWRSRTTVVTSAADTEDIVDHLLHPEIRLPRDWRDRSLLVLRGRDRYASRLLVTQLARRRSMSGRTIAVVGASDASASRVVATMIAVGAAGQTPTTLVETSRAGDHPLAPQDGGTDAARTLVADLDIVAPAPDDGSRHESIAAWRSAVGTARAQGRCVVIDVGDTTELLGGLPAEAETIVVIGMGVDTVPHSAALASALRGESGGLLGVATRQPWYLQMSRWFASKRHD